MRRDCLHDQRAEQGRARTELEVGGRAVRQQCAARLGLQAVADLVDRLRVEVERLAVGLALEARVGLNAQILRDLWPSQPRGQGAKRTLSGAFVDQTAQSFERDVVRLGAVLVERRFGHKERQPLQFGRQVHVHVISPRWTRAHSAHGHRCAADCEFVDPPQCPGSVRILAHALTAGTRDKIRASKSAAEQLAPSRGQGSRVLSSVPFDL